MSIVVVGLGLAPVAMGQDDKAAAGVNVTTAADSMKVGGEFRAELNYNDNGLQKTSGVSPDASTTINVDTAKIKMAGKLNPNTEYKFRFNLRGPSSAATAATYTPLDYGYGTHWFGPAGFSIGKMKVFQGGWDQLDHGFKNHVQGVYAENLAFADYEPSLTMHFKVAGQVNLQLLNDATVAKGNGEWNTSAHPTFVVNWTGDLGVVKPILSVGTFDNQKSRWIDVGAKTEMAGVKATFDVKLDSWVGKGVDPADVKKAREEETTATSMTLKAGYELKGTAFPWIYFSTYDQKQFEDSKTGAKDAKVNSVDPATGKIAWNDNGTSWGVGADLLSFGKNWSPYIAIVGLSGTVPDPKDATKEETRSEMQIRIGALGEM